MNNNILWGKEVYPYIISVLDSMNISRDYAPYVFAMAANESGWGLNPSGKYNYFGMKATKNLKGTVRTTHEGFGSNRVKINDKFLDFESLQDGIKRGIERLNNRFGAFSVPVKLFTWNLHLNGYYTDTPAHYEDTINGIINGRSFRNVLNGLSIPERLNINQTNWNSVPRWQPPVQFKKGGNLISKFQQGGAPRHYYTTDSNILPELIVSPQGNSYIVDEFGNPARTVDTLREAQQYGGYAGTIRDAMSGRELRNNLKLQGRDVYLAQQREADQIARDRTDGLSEGFANLMTLGAASTLKDGTQDFKNGHYLSGGFKLISPLMIPAFAKAPGMMIRGMVGGSVADAVSNNIWANTFGKGKTLAQDISDATSGRISEEEGHILNPATWWGFKMGMNSRRWRPNGTLGVNYTTNNSTEAAVKAAQESASRTLGDPPKTMTIRKILDIAKKRYGRYLDERELSELIEDFNPDILNIGGREEAIFRIPEQELEPILLRYFKLSEKQDAIETGKKITEPFWDTNAFDLVKVTDKGQHLIKEKSTGKSYIAEIKFKEQAQNAGLNTENTEGSTLEQKYELFLQKEFLPGLKKLIETNVSNDKIKAFFESYKMADRLSANDIKLLRTHAPYYNIPLRDSYSILRPVLDKAIKNAKGTKGINDKIKEILEIQRANTPEGKLEAIRNRIINEDTKETVWQRLKRAKDETGIDWRDDAKSNPGTYMTGMDTDLKLKPVGSNTTEPFIKRYYDNVIKHILDEGYLLKILDSGDLFYDKESKMWIGKWPDGKYYRVFRPEEYIKARYAREVKHADVELPKPEFVNETWYDRVPMHGAGLGENNMPVSKSQNNWLEYLRKPSSSPGKNGYWTIIRNWLATKSRAPEHYLLENYSVPFYMMPKYETETFYPGNSYGLMDLMKKAYSGKIMRPMGVQDGVPGVIDEYNFGPTFNRNPKSMWNTLDFAPGEGPMAYTPSKITVNGENYA